MSDIRDGDIREWRYTGMAIYGMAIYGWLLLLIKTINTELAIKHGAKSEKIGAEVTFFKSNSLIILLKTQDETNYNSSSHHLRTIKNRVLHQKRS